MVLSLVKFIKLDSFGYFILHIEQGTQFLFPDILKKSRQDAQGSVHARFDEFRHRRDLDRMGVPQRCR